MSNGPKLRAKKIACRLAAILCEEDVESGGVKLRYATLKEKGGPSVEAIEAGMRALIAELVLRGRP